TVAPLGGGRGERLHCDLILNAGGCAPAVHLHSQAGGKLRWVAESAMFVPDGAAPGLTSVGACAGVLAHAPAVSHAAEVGEALARGGVPPQAPVGGAGRSDAITRVPGVRGKQFVDLQNDVLAEDVALAARENYRSVEHLKRYTTTGMGTDQGKTSNINALILMGGYTGQDPPDVGTTRFRPPFAPVTLGAITGRRVGRLYRPLKRLPAHDWHAARGALFETFGDWSRPAAYPQAGETLEAAARREAGTVGFERTLASFEEWLQCEFVDLKVAVTPVTSRWGNVTVAGPLAWEWLAKVGFDAALAPGAMAHMTMRETQWESAPVRVLRASF